MDLQAFLSRCTRSPGAVCPMKSAWKAFSASLPAGRVAAWSRDRFQRELVAGGYTVADLDERAHIADLQLPGGAWRAEDGRLIFREVAA